MAKKEPKQQPPEWLDFAVDEIVDTVLDFYGDLIAPEDDPNEEFREVIYAALVDYWENGVHDE